MTEQQRKGSYRLPLVIRGNIFEGLTAGGTRVLVWPRRLLADHAGLEQEVSALKSGISGRLRSGIVYLDDTVPQDLLVLPLYEDRHVIIAADELFDGADEDGSGAVSLAEATALPLCLLSTGMRARRLIDQTLQTHGLKGRTTHRGGFAHLIADPCGLPAVGKHRPSGEGRVVTSAIR